jgi:hypothetical protein
MLSATLRQTQRNSPRIADHGSSRAFRFVPSVQAAPSPRVHLAGWKDTCFPHSRQTPIPTRVPIPKFASACGTLSCELRNQRDTSNSMILVPLFEPEVRNRTRGKGVRTSGAGHSCPDSEVRKRLQLLEPRPPAVLANAGSEAPPDSAGRDDRRRGRRSGQEPADEEIASIATSGPPPRVSRTCEGVASDSAIERRRAGETRPSSLCPLGFISRGETRFGPGAPPPADCAVQRWRSAGTSRAPLARALRCLRTTMRRDKAVMSSVLNLWNESRTNRARIADSAAVGIRSRPHLVAPPAHATRSCKPCKAVARRNVPTG